MTMLFNCLNSKQKQLQKYDPSEIVTSFAMLNRDNSTFYFPMVWKMSCPYFREVAHLKARGAAEGLLKTSHFLLFISLSISMSIFVSLSLSICVFAFIFIWLLLLQLNPSL